MANTDKLFQILSTFPWNDAVDLIEAAQAADPNTDVDEHIKAAAGWLDQVADFSQIEGSGAVIELFDGAIFEAALRLVWSTQSPEAKAERQARRAARRDRRAARRAGRTAPKS
jgi:hypothetical protein